MNTALERSSPAHEQARLSDAMSFLRRGRSLMFVLLLIVFCNGCKDSPPQVKEGPLFAAPEEASPAKALVYIYWPREEQGGRSHLWVGPCDGLSEEILPGGYTEYAVEPGQSCFQAEAQSELMRGMTFGSFVIRPLGIVVLNTSPGHTFFIRLGHERRSLFSRTVFRGAEPDVASAEIRRCRHSVPLTSDELLRLYSAEK